MSKQALYRRPNGDPILLHVVAENGNTVDLSRTEGGEPVVRAVALDTKATPGTAALVEAPAAAKESKK
jgi:hypothetical protein